jgi:uncharacterized membrane protein YvlD (DUF360 family)
MIRLLIRAAIFLVSAALGLLAAAWLLPDVHLSLEGFLLTVIIFAVAQSILSPFLARLSARNAPAFLGGIGLVTTFVALLISGFVPGGLSITGWRTWILCTLVVWLVTAIATFILPFFFLKKTVKKAATRIAP